MKQPNNRPPKLEATVPGIVVRTTRRGIHRLRWPHLHLPRPSKRFQRMAVGVVVVAAAGYLGWSVYNNHQLAINRIAFSIDGQNYTKQDIKTLTQYPVSHGATPSAAAKQAFDFYKRQVAAKQVGISLSPTEIAEAKAAVFPNITSNDPWITLVSDDAALTTRLATAPTYTTASGYYFTFPFSNHIATADATTAPTGTGDATLIAQDRAYAKAQADSYYNQLVQKKITPDQALVAIKADPKLGYDGFANSNTSFKFTNLGQSSSTSDAAYLSDAAKSYVFALANKVGVGAVTVGQMVTGQTSATNPIYTDANYYFVVITKAAPVQGSAQFQSTLNTIVANYRGIQ